jgi:hypothetical protein
MKSLVMKLIVSMAAITPVLAIAQTNEPVTRTQVNQNMVDLERVGFFPSRIGNSDYPDNIQSAEKQAVAGRMWRTRVAMAGTRK